MTGIPNTTAELITTEFPLTASSGSVVLQNMQNLIASMFNAYPTVVAAAGTTQGTATVLTEQFCIVTSGTGGVKVSLPFHKIWNATGNTILVYPPSSAQINALGTNVGGQILTLASAEVAFPAASPTQGYAR